MNEQICATKNGSTYIMCEHCSTAKFKADGSPYWMCEKYKVELKDNENKFLTKCKPCLNN